MFSYTELMPSVHEYSCLSGTGDSYCGDIVIVAGFRFSTMFFVVCGSDRLVTTNRFTSGYVNRLLLYA